jgi:murein DD-endopeptidase MepM/ murein hydrolase activator NlpD
LKTPKWLNCLLVLALFWPSGAGSAQPAQREQPNGPVYIVQPGDTLWEIAQRFGVSVDDLAQANDIANVGNIDAGTALVIPGLEGVQGTLVARDVPFGESLRSLSRRYQIPPAALARLNHLILPSELYAGGNLIIPEVISSTGGLKRLSLAPGQSLLELAALNDANPWALVEANQLTHTWSALPEDVLFMAGNEKEVPGALPGPISAVEIDPLPLSQGKASVIRLSAPRGLQVSGGLMGHPLRFFYDGSGAYIALQGVHALAEPGLYTLAISGTLPGGAPFAFDQMVNVQSENYPYDRPLTVDPETIDPAVTQPEDALWTGLAQPATGQKLWGGRFKLPSSLPEDYCVETGECWSSRFGNRRSYNGSPYKYFHTGLDIVGKVGAEIFAPAPGVVVFTGPLTVRGNATMIDHGWGVYTGYMHQSEILVKVGDHVETGQLIGYVGDTGRAEGPHLHWEVWVGGVQVDPLDWLTQVYP